MTPKIKGAEQRPKISVKIIKLADAWPLKCFGTHDIKVTKNDAVAKLMTSIEIVKKAKKTSRFPEPTAIIVVINPIVIQIGTTDAPASVL